MAHKKINLPEKICIVCQLPFSWRKKWEKNWEQVKYCSDKCRLKRNSNNKIPNSN
ncbi:DUF2256 domain-containing protein [Flavobacterium gelidilacus]|jgi:hypothetical protein|uniref:DUF2256 domain-containing protein n=1 Tax=Flavobacterium gelidilacus TaxID=206041 RepID=UPI0003F4EC48|nr:DUF2256 domain-containing protein [Flavobacterium gelidilacus]